MVDAQKKEKERQDVGEATSPYVLGFTVRRSWAGLPGRELVFNLRMYESGELIELRQAGIGVTNETERRALLLDYRMRVLADVLEEPPGGFPDFPDSVKIKTGEGEADSTKLSDRAYAFFNRRDKAGRPIFKSLVESVVKEFWERAIPDPILPVSES
jgi:hypothetical protein